MKKLKHVANFRAGGTPDTGTTKFWADENTGVPWVAIGDMSSRAVVTQTTKCLTKAGLRDRGLEPSPPGTVLFAMYASVGAVSTLGVDAVWNQALLGVSPNPGAADGRFLAYWLRHHGPRAVADAKTATQANLNAEQVANFPFPVHTFDEQRRIADFLDDRVACIDQIIAGRRAQIALTREHIDATIDGLINTGTQSLRPLQSLTDPQRPIQYGIVLPGPDFDGGVPIVKGGDIGSGRMQRLELNRTDPEIERAYRRSRIRPGDLVIAIRGSVGEVAEVPESLPLANLTQDSARIAAWGCDPAWLHMALESPTVQSAMAERMTGSTVRGINIEALRRVPIPLPDHGGQKSIGRLALQARSTGRAHIGALSASNDLLFEYKQSLITAAVTGELDVTTSGSGIPL